MKLTIIFFIAFGMLFSNPARSQEKSFKGIAVVDLNGARLIDITKSKNSKLAKSKYSIVSNIDSNVGEFYEINGMLLFINGECAELKPDHLEQIEKGFKEMGQWRPGDTEFTKLETFDQYRVLVMNYDFEDQGTGRYSFFSVTKNNKKILNGVLEYELTDKTKASEVLEKFIKGIKFK